MRKYKLTGCARFFIFLLIATPIAYFAASYYNNQNPIQTVKTWFTDGSEYGQSLPPPAATRTDSTGIEAPADSVKHQGGPDAETNRNTSTDEVNLREILNEKDRRIEQLIRENERLRNEVERLKGQE